MRINFTERNKRRMKELAKDFCDELEIGDFIYNQVLDMIDLIGPMKGFSTESTVLAIIYLVARKPGNKPVMLGDILEVAKRHNVGRVNSCIRKVNEMFQLSVDGVTPERLLGRYGYKLGLSEGMIRTTESVLRKIKYRSGKPTGWAAAAVYLTLNSNGDRRITEREVSDFFKVSEVTVRDKIKLIKETVADDS